MSLANLLYANRLGLHADSLIVDAVTSATNGLTINAPKVVQLGRLTTAQRTGLTGVVAGSICYDTDLNQLFLYGGSGWEAIEAGGGTIPDPLPITDIVSKGGDGVTVTGTPGDVTVASGTEIALNAPTLSSTATSMMFNGASITADTVQVGTVTCNLVQADEGALNLTGTTLKLNDIQWPNADGGAAQVLSTNGAGVLGWANGGVTSVASSDATVTVTNGSGPAVNVVVNPNLSIQSVTCSGNITAESVMLYAGGTYGHTILQSPESVYTAYTLTMPDEQCPSNGYVLAGDTSGQLAWADPAGSGVSEVTSTGGTITIANPTGPAVNVEVDSNLTLTTLTTTGAIETEKVMFLASGGGGSYGYTYLQSPASAYSGYTLTLPNQQCPTSGYVLASDTSGQLSWVNGAVATTGSDTVAFSCDAWAAPVNSTVSYQRIGNFVTLFIKEASSSTNGSSGQITGTLPAGFPIFSASIAEMQSSVPILDVPSASPVLTLGVLTIENDRTFRIGTITNTNLNAGLTTGDQIGITSCCVSYYIDA